MPHTLSDMAERETRRAIIAAPVSDAATTVMGKLRAEFAQTLPGDGLTRLPHQIQVIVQIVDRIQLCPENLVDSL